MIGLRELRRAQDFKVLGLPNDACAGEERVHDERVEAEEVEALSVTA